MKRDWPCRADAAALVLLALLTLALHHSALSGSWRWDDGMHLLHTTQYSWSDVFLDPKVLLSVSGNQFAPWNLFLYYINGALFGSDVRLYYAHHLVSLWAAAASLYALLRQWLPTSRAWLAPGLLLIGVPAFQMAQQLMVGHYLDGLVFANLGLLAHIRAVRAYGNHGSKTAALSLASALLYGLACLCKEIYVPWILLWLVVSWMLTPSPRKVAACTIPALLVALAYTIARLKVFAGAGGYYGGGSNSWEPAHLLQSMRALSSALFGEGVHGLVPLFLAVIALFAGNQSPHARAQRVVCASALIVVLVPLMFLAGSNPPWERHTRYLWAPWLLLCLIWSMPWTGALQRVQWIACLVFAIFTLWQVTILRPADQEIEALFDAHSHMVLQPPSGVTHWMPGEFNSPGYLTFVSYAAQEAWRRRGHSQGEPPKLLRSIPSNLEERGATRVWDASCQCFQSLAALTPEALSATSAQLRSNKGMLLPGVHPLADEYQGPTPEMRVEGSHLYISGTAAAEGGGHILILAGWSPAKLTASRLINQASPDKPGTQVMRFDISLEAKDAATAQQVRDQLCVLTHSQARPYTFVALDARAPSTACRRLLTPFAFQQAASQ